MKYLFIIIKFTSWSGNIDYLEEVTVVNPEFSIETSVDAIIESMKENALGGEIKEILGFKYKISDNIRFDKQYLYENVYDELKLN